MFEVGDLVTVDSDALRHHVHENIHKQWSTNTIGIVLAVESYPEGAAVLVKVHFESLGDAGTASSRCFGATELKAIIQVVG